VGGCWEGTKNKKGPWKSRLKGLSTNTTVKRERESGLQLRHLGGGLEKRGAQKQFLQEGYKGRYKWAFFQNGKRGPVTGKGKKKKVGKNSRSGNLKV